VDRRRLFAVLDGAGGGGCASISGGFDEESFAPGCGCDGGWGVGFCFKGVGDVVVLVGEDWDGVEVVGAGGCVVGFWSVSCIVASSSSSWNGIPVSSSVSTSSLVLSL